ncbi:MAG TPA: hypothetical protein VNL14_10295 [Candidatus Acidoferrales bacterium]|nr:hypothetical protein [Candidatus Acidoferrales bacterium]
MLKPPLDAQSARSFDRTYRAIGGDAEISGGLRRARVGAVAEPRKERRDGIGVAEPLNLLAANIYVKLQSGSFLMDGLKLIEGKRASQIFADLKRIGRLKANDKH